MQYTFELTEVVHKLGTGKKKYMFAIRVTLEFGSESGVAESMENEAVLKELVSRSLAKSKAMELMMPEGKLKLKQDLTRRFNNFFKTAAGQEHLLRQVHHDELEVACLIPGWMCI
jgi:flagellar basal body-associated protein FliL